MIPIKNKKKTLEATVDEMRQFSFSYIEKYAPSKQQLKTYLLKKYLKNKIKDINKKNITDLIEVVLEDLEKNKFINDKFYSKSKAKSLINRGSSINKIRNYLLSKGINNNYITETISEIKENNEDQDFFSAINFVKRNELVLREMKIIDLYFIKKIWVFWLDQDLILKHQKKLLILIKMNI